MVLADTSVWVEHLRRADATLAGLLQNGEVACHPFIIGEIACGSLRNRREVLNLMAVLPSLAKASDSEILHFIERQRVSVKGLGIVDVHLLASCLLAGASMWTLDRKLRRTALEIGLEAR
jgi:hypothetical protein